MRNDALETQLERSLDVADDRVDDGVDGAPGRIRDDRVLAVEVEHHRLAVCACERLELDIARLHGLELGETGAHGLQECGEVLVWRLSRTDMKLARQRPSARPACVHTISINFSPLAESSSSRASSTACRLRFPVPAPSSFAAVRTALAIARSMMLAFALLRSDGSWSGGSRPFVLHQVRRARARHGPHVRKQYCDSGGTRRLQRLLLHWRYPVRSASGRIWNYTMRVASCGGVPVSPG